MKNPSELAADGWEDIGMLDSNTDLEIGHPIHCTLDFMGTGPMKGTVTFREKSPHACFVSTDGSRRIMLARELLDQMERTDHPDGSVSWGWPKPPMELTSADTFHVTGRGKVFAFKGIKGFHPGVLRGKEVMIDGMLYQVRGVELYAIPDPTGRDFGLLVKEPKG
jgi:hypothetical protein